MSYMLMSRVEKRPIFLIRFYQLDSNLDIRKDGGTTEEINPLRLAYKQASVAFS